MNLPDIDICIIGAGVVGTSIAREVHAAYPTLEVLLIEQNQDVGMVTSSRNSEVIHAGLYYPPQSLKAKHCLIGQVKLKEFCEERHIPCNISGKYIVANKGDEASLKRIAKNAERCGVHSLKRVSRQSLKKLEPNVEAEQALFSPTTAIIDSHQYMLALMADIPANGVSVGTELLDIEPEHCNQQVAFKLTFKAQGDSALIRVTSKLLINTAGLAAPFFADQLYAHSAGQMKRPDWLRGKFEYSKGSYFSYSGKSPFSSLIYPVPTSDGRGLGVHATLDLGGQCRFGPDVERLQLDAALIKGANQPGAAIYSVEPTRLAHFTSQVSRYFPDLDPDRLKPGYSGIRCQWKSPEGYTDFQIDDQLAEGIGLLQYLGIDSPGLTASLSLAEDAVKRIRQSQLFR